MALFERTQFEEDEDMAGVHMGSLGRALVTWAAMNYGQPLTVATAALAFNTTPDVIREAIEGGMWIEYYGPADDPAMQKIELDGE